MERSRSVRRIEKRTAKGRHVIRYKRRSRDVRRCGICGAEINGIPMKRKIRGGKSRKSVERVFGGTLCAACTERVLRNVSRIENGEIKLKDIGIKEREYILELTSH
ncbi:MAG: hypothetical protein QXL16_01250 [Candidatus Micrarchaeaceae archaeon]